MTRRGGSTVQGTPSVTASRDTSLGEGGLGTGEQRRNDQCKTKVFIDRFLYHPEAPRNVESKCLISETNPHSGTDAEIVVADTATVAIDGADTEDIGGAVRIVAGRPQTPPAIAIAGFI